MKYNVIFTSGYSNDLEWNDRGYRTDILLLDENDNYYEVNFIELEVIKNQFEKDKICYLETNIVVLHEVTKDNILKSIPKLYKWQFYNRWRPLTEEQVKKYYYPKENWVIFEVSEDSTLPDNS